jgi:acetyltransferase-like isoleucine patch superfamily enzyme
MDAEGDMSDDQRERPGIPEPNCFTRPAGVLRRLTHRLGHLRQRLRYLGRPVSFDRTCTIEPTSRMRILNGGSISLGRYCEIYDHALMITYGGEIAFGDFCSVNQFAVIYGHGGLRVGNGVRIAAHTVIIPANHIFDDAGVPICLQGETKRGIVIEDDVWIGAGCLILDGVTIQRGAVIGAGSVVSRSIPAYAVATGAPARVIRRRGEASPS